MRAPPFLLYVLVKKHGFLYASSSFLAKSSFWNEVAEKAVTWGRYVFYFLLALHCFLRHCLIQWLQSVSCTQRLQLFQPIALILFFFLQTVPKRQSGQSCSLKSSLAMPKESIMERCEGSSGTRTRHHPASTEMEGACKVADPQAHPRAANPLKNTWCFLPELSYSSSASQREHLEGLPYRNSLVSSCKGHRDRTPQVRSK